MDRPVACARAEAAWLEGRVEDALAETEAAYADAQALGRRGRPGAGLLALAGRRREPIPAPATGPTGWRWPASRAAPGLGGGVPVRGGDRPRRADDEALLRA